MGRVTYAEEIKATPEQVWTILSDATRLPEWAFTEGRFPYPVEGRYGSEQREGVGAIWIGVSGDGQVATQKVTVWEPSHRLAYELQQMENAALQMAQVNTFDLQPTDHGTRVIWTVDWKLIGGWSLNAILIRLTGNGVFEEMIAGSLENLKKVVEVGGVKR
ncbi:MAG: SRPBCC family protein [Anaerolineae bacterium]